jgi:nucleoside-diphosphate-sugar epimerase
MGGKILRVLVTGGAGFIGSHIVDGLLNHGYEIGVLDNLETGDERNLAHRAGSFEWHRGDLRDMETVRRAVKGHDAIVHQGALVSVTRSVEDPLLTNEVNVTGTLNVLKASVDSGVSRFVFASSSSVYGETETLPKREDMPTRPVSPYGVSKLSAENYCIAFSRVYGLHTVCLRYFNVYGPRQKFGPYSGVIPAFIRKIRNGEPPLIFGDGSQTRDFTYVLDVVDANLLSLTADVAAGEVFNIAAGRICSINELADCILTLMGRADLRPVYTSARAGDIRASYADISKASLSLGYRPKFELVDGLGKVIEWFASNPL